jgi:hypothetical protein
MIRCPACNAEFLTKRDLEYHRKMVFECSDNQIDCLRKQVEDLWAFINWPISTTDETAVLAAKERERLRKKWNRSTP